MYLNRIVLLFVVLSVFFDNNILAQTITFSKKEITVLTDQASQYLKETNFSKSLEISKIALHEAILANDFSSIAISYNTIAANYAELAQFEKAIFFYNKALINAKKIEFDTLSNKIYNNLGNIYCFEKKQYLKGIAYYQNSLKYSQKIADTNQIFMTKLNITWAYFDIKNFEKGYDSLKYINNHKSKKGDDSSFAAISMLNAMYYAHEGNNEKANAFFLKAIKLGNETDQKSDLSFAHLEYSKFLIGNGDFKNGYLNLSKYNEITDALYSKDKMDQANSVGVNLELEDYKREIDKFEAEKKANLILLGKSKTILFLFLAISVILLLLIYSLFKNNNLKKKSNSDLSHSNKQLLIAIEKAEVASKLKSQFVSTVSHELRTPLYGVVGITNILAEEHKELANSPYLSSLKFSARYLLSLVNDILQINKIEDKRIVLENLTFNLLDEINLVKNSLSFLAKQNNNSIVVNIDPDIPDYLIGDKLRFSQIIMNLVSNALKFTSNGEVSISANLIKTVHKTYFIAFIIADNGIGIAVEDQEKIFDKFVQIRRKETDYQGTGLGLSIVKQLLELFDSSISVESSINKGSIFKFVIGFEYNPEKTIDIINSIQVNLSHSPNTVNVLVVEDNRINQLVTKKTIEKNNFKCSVVDNGYAAIEILEKEYFDIILMDINMPLINGFDTTRKIRSKGIITPIVALTAFDKAEITEEAISAGINDIIMKPFDAIKLVDMITILISKN